MKNIFLILITLVFAYSKAQEIVELPLPESDRVIVKLMFKNGSVSDPIGKEGLTSLTASLIAAGGTKDLTALQVQEKIYPMAARIYAKTDKEVTIFTFEVHKDFIVPFYDIIKGLILTPAFDEKDFERIKSNQLNYVDKVIRASSDEEYSKMALEDMLFNGTRYQHMTSGRVESVKGITLEDVRNHYKNVFTNGNLMIGIAGSYTSDFKSMLFKDLKSLPPTPTAIITDIPMTYPDGINVKIIEKDAFGSAIFMGFPMNITRAQDDFAALMIANSYLGEHRKSYGRLYDKIRTTRSMNYGDYSYIEWYDNGGSNMLPPPGVPRTTNYFAIWIRPVQIAKQLKQQYQELSNVKIGHAHFAIRLALREVDMLIKNGMTEKDFNATKEFLQSYIKLYIQSPSNRLGYLMDSRFYNRKDFIKETEDLFANITLDDVNRAIKKYWQIDNMDIVIITDKSEAKELSTSLLNNTPSPMSYSDMVKAGLPMDVLAEDEEVANFQLNVKDVKIIDNEETFK